MAPRIDLVAKRLMKKAMEGDMAAMRQVFRMGEALSPLKALVELEDLETQAERQAIAAELAQALNRYASDKKKGAPRANFDEHGNPRAPKPADAPNKDDH